MDNSGEKVVEEFKAASEIFYNTIDVFFAVITNAKEIFQQSVEIKKLVENSNSDSLKSVYKTVFSNFDKYYNEIAHAYQTNEKLNENIYKITAKDAKENLSTEKISSLALKEFDKANAERLQIMKDLSQISYDNTTILANILVSKESLLKQVSSLFNQTNKLMKDIGKERIIIDYAVKELSKHTFAKSKDRTSR